MAADVADLKKDDVRSGLDPRISSETFTKEICQEPDLVSSSSYTLASQSQLSSDVDRWIHGSTIQSMGVQNTRAHLTQQSTLATSASTGISSMWYALAMMLPLFNMNISCSQWRCNRRTMMSSAEGLYAHVTAACQSIRNHIRRLARDQVVRELFATALDVVLLVYAVGFLVISMYQAAVIG